MTIQLTLAILTALFMWTPFVIVLIMQVLDKDYQKQTRSEKIHNAIASLFILFLIFILAGGFIMTVTCDFSDGIAFNGNLCQWPIWW